MQIPLYLEVAQWALLFGLGGLVVVLYRQLGRMLGQSGKRPEPGPAVGSRATSIRYERVPDGAPGLITPGDGRPALIAFVDPTCPACEQLVSTLGGLRNGGELRGARILLLMSDPPRYVGISAVFRASSLELGRPVSPAEVHDYQATVTPLLVAVDVAGVVRAAGAVTRPGQVRAFAGLITKESEAAR
jgi:hypothetical protein